MVVIEKEIPVEDIIAEKSVVNKNVLGHTLEEGKLS